MGYRKQKSPKSMTCCGEGTVAFQLLVILSSPFVWNNTLSQEYILTIDFISSCFRVLLTTSSTLNLS